MIIQLDKLGDFNQVIDYYKRMLSIAKTTTPKNIDIPRINHYSPEFAYYRAAVNNIGISIAQNFDILEKKILKNEISEDYINDRILFELENGGQITEDGTNVFSLLKESFERIMKDNNHTPFQTLKQIRNALLHGNYSLEIKDDNPDDSNKFKLMDTKSDKFLVVVKGNNITLHIKSKSMTGEINYDIANFVLEYFYDKLRDAYAGEDKTIYYSDRRFLSCKNSYYFQSYIDSIKAYRVIGSKEEDNMNTILIKYPDLFDMINELRANTGNSHFEVEELSEEETNKRKEFLKNYINYIGKDKWQYIETLPEYYRYLIFENILTRSSFDRYSNVTDINNTFCETVFEASLDDIFSRPLNDYSRETFKTLAFEAPVIYSNMLLGLANYTGLYLKEQNNSNDIPLFEYHNISGFEGIEILIDKGDKKSIQKHLSGEEKKEKYDKYIESLNSQIQSLKSKLNKAKRLKEKLNDKNPKKQELLSEYNKTIEENTKQIEIISKKIEQIRKRKEEYEEDYTDYSEFFRHLRNSIAHGNYTIEYNKALTKKDLSRIEYTFYDYPEGEEEIPEFKVKLTASKLLKIINGVQTRVNNQLSNESKVDQIEKTDYLKQLFYEHQIQEDEEDENSKRPKETGLSPERIESGISSIGHLEIDKNEQIK